MAEQAHHWLGIAFYSIGLMVVVREAKEMTRRWMASTSPPLAKEEPEGSEQEAS